ncbi:MAG: GtrA family protein [Bacteroidales bacterium]|nr:GtrA family protein [Bacteroidales bacterium]
MEKIVIIKFLKFVSVGFSGLLIDFGITWLLKEKLNIQKYVANATGFICAASSNYFLNRIWTFESHNPEIAVEYSLFLLISVVGLIINTLVLWALDSKFKWNFYFSKLIAIGVVTLWNFIMNFLFTFV